eukprot:scaffold51241_cov64-Phaeocystis_antarctica.AAC.4
MSTGASERSEPRQQRWHGGGSHSPDDHDLGLLLLLRAEHGRHACERCSSWVERADKTDGSLLLWRLPVHASWGVGVAVLGARDAEVEAARSLEQLVEEHVPLVARHHVVEARRALLVPVVVAPGDLGGAALARAAAGVEAVEARRAAEQQRLDQQHRACGAVRL